MLVYYWLEGDDFITEIELCVVPFEDLKFRDILRQTTSIEIENWTIEDDMLVRRSPFYLLKPNFFKTIIVLLFFGGKQLKDI